MRRALRPALWIAAGYPMLACAIAHADATVPQPGAGAPQAATPPCHSKGATQVQQQGQSGDGAAPTVAPKKHPVIMGRMPRPSHAMVIHPHAPGEPCLDGIHGVVIV